MSESQGGVFYFSAAFRSSSGSVWFTTLSSVMVHFTTSFMHDFLDDRAKAAGAGIALDSLAGDRMDGSVFDDELYAVHGQQLLVLLDEGILRFGQDFDEGFFLQRVKGDNDGETADEFGDEAEFQEVFRLDLLEERRNP